MSKCENLECCMNKTAEVLRDVFDAKNLLFGEENSTFFQKGYVHFQQKFQDLKKSLPELLSNNKNAERLDKAGLSENSGQLSFKLKTFEMAFNNYKKHGSIKLLDKVLEIAGIIFGSLGKALEEVGSYIEEFISVVRFYLSKHLGNSIN